MKLSCCSMERRIRGPYSLNRRIIDRDVFVLMVEYGAVLAAATLVFPTDIDIEFFKAEICFHFV